jgi:predicted Zn finger-like uncharacterized protein
MTLATTCPRCKTSFKVVADQLKLRRGMVRCGVCQTVFSGLEQLRYVESEAILQQANEAAARAAQNAARSQERVPEATPPRPPESIFLPNADSNIGAKAQTNHSESLDDLGPDFSQASDSSAAFGVPLNQSIEQGSKDAFFDQSGDLSNVGSRRSRSNYMKESDEHQIDTTKDQFERPTAIAKELINNSQVPEFIKIDSSRDDTILALFSEQNKWSKTQLKSDTVRRSDRRSDQQNDKNNNANSRQNADDHPTAMYMPDGWPSNTPGKGAHPPDSIKADQQNATEKPISDFKLSEEDAVDFFSSEGSYGTPRDRFTKMARTIAMVGLSFLLILQLALLARNWLSVRVPALEPALNLIASPFGLSVELPRDLSVLTIESFDVQASAKPDVLAVSSMLRNRSAYPVQWPALELTLTGTDGRPILKKILQPSEYLKQSSGAPNAADQALLKTGIKSNAEYPLRLGLQTENLRPTGYSVNLFYN